VVVLQQCVHVLVAVSNLSFSVLKPVTFVMEVRGNND